MHAERRAGTSGRSVSGTQTPGEPSGAPFPVVPEFKLRRYPICLKLARVLTLYLQSNQWTKYTRELG